MEGLMVDETILRLQQRINELERRVDFLYNHLNLTQAEGAIDNLQLITAIQKGDKIEAIKIYRTLTNCDLITGKQAVENIWNRYHLA
jgi:ribosomal protein L7/L12